MICALLFLCALVLGACGDSVRAPAVDAAVAIAPDAGPGTPTTCALPAGAHADALAFTAPDTILYTYSDDGVTRWIGRQDGAIAQPTWLEADTIIGKMVVVDRTLYFTDARANVYAVDLDASPPSAIGVFTPSQSDDTTRYGLAADAAGTLYATDGGRRQEHIWRRPRGGAWSEVTTSPFDTGTVGSMIALSDGDLEVVTLYSNDLWRFSIGPDGKETARARLATVTDAGGLDFGLGRDETGALYVLSAGSQTLERVLPPSFDEQILATPTGYLGGMAFGLGCWGTHDVYIASLGAVLRVDVGASGAP